MGHVVLHYWCALSEMHLATVLWLVQCLSTLLLGRPGFTPQQLHAPLASVWSIITPTPLVASYQRLCFVGSFRRLKPNLLKVSRSWMAVLCPNTSWCFQIDVGAVWLLAKLPATNSEWNWWCAAHFMTFLCPSIICATPA